jgi:uncharacterized protein YkwD
MYQPMTRGPLVTLARGRVAAIVASVVVATAAAGAMASPALAHGGDGLRAAANEYRLKGGLDPVFGTNLLDDIATKRVTQMVNQGYMEHDLDYVGKRLDASGVCYKSTFGEILAWERGYPDYSYDRTMLAWMKSKPHHDIVMGSDYNAAGGAWRLADDGAHYSVMIFVELCNGSPSKESVPRLGFDSRYDPDRTLVLWAGTHTGYKLNENGEVLDHKTVNFDSWATRRAAGRARAGGSAWLKVSTGALDGYWVREAPSSFVRGTTAYHAFATDRAVVVAAGTYRGLKFDRLGRVTDARSRTFSHESETQVSARAIINGRAYLKFSSGYLGGYWVRDTDSIDLI